MKLGLDKDKAEHIRNLLNGYLNNIKSLEKLKVPEVGCGRARRTTYVARSHNIAEGRDNYEKYFFEELEKFK